MNLFHYLFERNYFLKSCYIKICTPFLRTYSPSNIMIKKKYFSNIAAKEMLVAAYFQNLKKLKIDIWLPQHLQHLPYKDWIT